MNLTGAHGVNDILVQLMNLLLLLMLASLTVSMIMGLRRKKQPKPVIRTRVECLNCGYTLEREYRRGDYIGKVEGSCPKCGSPMIITAVYEERLGERREEERLLRLVERRASSSRGTRRSG